MNLKTTVGSSKYTQSIDVSCSHPTAVFRWKRRRGFSLVEVLIALAVLALALSALIGASGSAARNTAHLQEKTFAHWVAMNKMEEIRLSGIFPELGIKEGKSTLVGREWRWEAKVQETPEKHMRRVDVRVRRPGDSKDTSLDVVTGYFARP